MNLKSKTENQLVLELKDLVVNERKILTEILHYLHEVDSRKIHLARGYPSLFEFATRELGYSSGAAQRRIEAMRLIRILPEVEKEIRNGTLSLSVAAQAQSFFRSEDSRGNPLSTETKREVVLSLLGSSSRECERRLAELSPETLPPEKSRALAGGKMLIQFVADFELAEKLDRLKRHLSHKNPSGRYDALFHELADLALRKFTRSFPTSEIKTSSRSRYIPQNVRRWVRSQDGDACTFLDLETGKVCGSKYQLQFDHIVPFAWGGETTAENLTLRCAKHNRFLAEKLGLRRA